MIADDIWDMLLGKAGKLPGTLAPEIIEKAEREGRKVLLPETHRIIIRMRSISIAR